MKFGIELECWSPLNLNLTKTFLQKKGISVGVGYLSRMWDIREDGSLNDGPVGFYGIELVSPILDTDNAEDLRTIRKLCEIIQAKGFRVDHQIGRAHV